MVLHVENFLGKSRKTANPGHLLDIRMRPAPIVILQAASGTSVQERSRRSLSSDAFSASEIVGSQSVARNWFVSQKYHFGASASGSSSPDMWTSTARGNGTGLPSRAACSRALALPLKLLPLWVGLIIWRRQRRIRAVPTVATPWTEN